MMKKIRLLSIMFFSLLLLGSNISCSDSETKEIPEIPEVPKTPEEPEIPEGPEEPGTPEEPENPEITELKVLQLNIWHEGTTVPDGFRGIVSIIDQLNPDIVFLCEINNRNGIPFIPRLVNALIGKRKNYYGESLNLGTGILSKFELKNAKAFSNPGSITKASVDIEGQTFVLYSAHLDYTHYECYLPRGYSGTTWKKLDAPVTDVNKILEANRIATRDEAIAAFIVDAEKEIQQKNIVIMGGDFNEPSHLDWQEDTKNLWDHNGVVINWDCSVMLTDAGFIDTYRQMYSDAAKYPGFTFPAGNKNVNISELAWAPDVDERDRIDFIYYYPNKAIELSDIKIVGPSESVYYGKIGKHDAYDEFIEPTGIWPTDHKGNLATFSLKKEE